MSVPLIKTRSEDAVSYFCHSKKIQYQNYQSSVINNCKAALKMSFNKFRRARR